jgi:hypothetical protein
VWAWNFVPQTEGRTKIERVFESRVLRRIFGAK